MRPTDNPRARNEQIQRLLETNGLRTPEAVQQAIDARQRATRDQLHTTLSDRDWSQRLTPAQRAALPPQVADRISRFEHAPNIVINQNNVNVIRNDFYRHHYPSYWTPDWYTHHSRAWHCPVSPHVWWHRPVWSSCWGWFATGFFAGVVVDRVIEPIPYYYGSNIYYSNGMVYVNGVPYVSAEEYYAQARQLAATPAQPTQVNINVTNTTPAANNTVADTADEWLPLGTFAILATPDATAVTRVLQLATNKTGQVRGNIVDTESDRVHQVIGAVDAKTQRVAISPVDDQKMVIECGLWNLTQDTLTVLVHRDANRSEERTLVRLTEPEEQKAEPKTEPKTEPPIL